MCSEKTTSIVNSGKSTTEENFGQNKFMSHIRTFSMARKQVEIERVEWHTHSIAFSWVQSVSNCVVFQIQY